MSYLGDRLDLPEGSRITSIALMPYAEQVLSTEGNISLQLLRLHNGANAGVAARAVEVFLPSLLAAADGNDPDGGTWLALFLYSPDDSDAERVEAMASAATLRAIELTRLTCDSWTGQTLSADDLRWTYGYETDINLDDWSVSELLHGLLAELTNADLAALVQSAAATEHDAENVHEHRRGVLSHALREWAVTYEGPES